jgi:hypothetical protein
MARPYRLSISSRDLKREKMIGTYSSMGRAMAKLRKWQAQGWQTHGCMFYLVSNTVGREYIVR